MTLWMCLYCDGTGCVRCSETGRFDYCSPALTPDQLKREDEEIGRIRAWLYSTEELVHRLGGQGLNVEKISALRAELRGGRDVSSQAIDEAVSKIICIGFDYARLVEIRQRTPAPSVLARELTAKAEHLRASAEIVREAELGALFFPEEIMPEVAYWETRHTEGVRSPKYISLDIQEGKLEDKILKLARDVQEYACFLNSPIFNTVVRRNNMFYIFVLTNIRNNITKEEWNTLKIGGHEYNLSPLLRFLRLATGLISKTSSGRNIVGISAANLRRYAVEAKLVGAAVTNPPA